MKDRAEVPLKVGQTVVYLHRNWNNASEMRIGEIVKIGEVFVRIKALTGKTIERAGGEIFVVGIDK